MTLRINETKILWLIQKLVKDAFRVLNTFNMASNLLDELYDSEHGAGCNAPTKTIGRNPNQSKGSKFSLESRRRLWRIGIPKSMGKVIVGKNTQTLFFKHFLELFC